MERGHSRVSLPWRPFSPFAWGIEPRLLPGDTQPPLQSGVAMLLKFWELKWNLMYQEEFSRRHFIREGCTHSSFSIPPSCFLKRWCHDESLAAMSDHEKGGLEMVSSSVERNLSHRPPEITNYRLPNGMWLYEFINPLLLEEFGRKFPNQRTSVDHHPKSHTKFLYSLPEKEAGFL